MVAILHNEYQEIFDNISIVSESSISEHKTMVKHFKSSSIQIDANLNDASRAHLKSKDTLETNVLEDDIDHDNTGTADIMVSEIDYRYSAAPEGAASYSSH